MKTKLKIGQILKIGTKTYTIGNFLGSGSQGEVFEAILDGKKYAIKWYFSSNANDEQRKVIEYLIKIGPPNKNFLWPLELATIPFNKSFGYIMDIRKSSYHPLVDMMKRRIEPSFESLIKAGTLLAKSFDLLHSKKLCYRDISFGNVFINPDNGEILICDNDNIAYEKSELKNVMGTPRFMAPEIVTNKSLPDIDSDRFSLAILIFYMFMLHHPFEGALESRIKCFDLPAMKKLYGENPVFIFDPRNSSNRPLRNRHQNAIIYWDLYPVFFKNIFIKVFTSGISDKGKRPSEKEWIRILSKLLGSIVKCSCGAENFEKRIDSTKTAYNRCWNCDAVSYNSFKLQIDDRIIVLNSDTKIYAHQLDERHAVSFISPAAVINPHPKRNGIWGLKNLSDNTWEVFKNTGESLLLSKGYSIALERGLRIDFGKVKARVIL